MKNKNRSYDIDAEARYTELRKIETRSGNFLQIVGGRGLFPVDSRLVSGRPGVGVCAPWWSERIADWVAI